MEKVRVAIANLCGCFGCEEELRTADRRSREYFDLVMYPPPPSDRPRRFPIGLIEGACASQGNLATLHGLREDCDLLVTLGECARLGSLPRRCPRRSDPARVSGVRVSTGTQTEFEHQSEELSLVLESVFPCQWIVPIDFEVVGCPPSADEIWRLLERLVSSSRAQTAG